MRNREDILHQIGYHEGYIDACYDYAVNENGELRLGCGVYKYKDVEKKHREVIDKLDELLSNS